MKKKVKKRKLAVSCGDPAGIGPETLLKAWSLLPKIARNNITVFGDPYYFSWLNRKLKTNTPILDESCSAKANDGLRVTPAGEVKFKATSFGKVNKVCGAAAMESVTAAAKAVINGEYDALVTAPINKESVNLAGYKIAGHTEYLAELCGGVNVAMMLACKKLKVVVATTHISIKDVPKALSAEKLVSKLKLISSSLKKMTGRKPKIAVCGLNPHASDGGLFGDEEERVIAPAIANARRFGVRATGPYPADTLFTQRSIKTFDIALAMYHDQGLIPVKLLGFGETVNVTLGLPFLRVSVDHGTAFDIAGKNRADAGSMAYAIRTAFDILNGRFT